MFVGVKEILSSIEPSQRQNYALKAQAELYKRSLYVLGKKGLGYKDLNPRTHKDTIDALESDSTRKLIVLPRGSLKSSVCDVAYPIHSLLNNPNERILITSELYTNSKNFLREIKYHLEGERMTSLFGDFRGDVWNESEITIRQRTKNVKEASITVGGVGTTKVGQHYDKIICDDLNSPDNTNTSDNAERVLSFFKYLISILEPTGTLVVVGTRYSELDVIGHILRSELNIEGVPTTGTYEVN